MNASFELFVPGRIEVLGKHTDYAGGRSLTCAVDRGFYCTVSATADAVLRIGRCRADSVALPISAELAARPGHWTDYPRVVAQRFAAVVPAPWRGADIVYRSDLPSAAGLSSSSALITACWLALAGCNEEAVSERLRTALTHNEGLADFLGCVENGRPFPPLESASVPAEISAAAAGSTSETLGAVAAGVGTLGGCEDHVAILCSRPGELRQYSYGPVRFERSIRLPETLLFVVAGSGVRAAKAAGARESYNRLSSATSEAAELWRRGTGRGEPHLGAILASDRGAEEALLALLQEAGMPGDAWHAERCRAFCEESERLVPGASEALHAGELEEFGHLVERSQQIAEQTLGNQVPETAHLASSARRLGAHAASAFGGGFGGAVWALIEHAAASDFLRAWRAEYQRCFPHRAGRAVFFTTRPGKAAALYR